MLLPAIIFLAVIAAAVVVIVLTQNKSGVKNADIEDTVARLQALEARDVNAIDSATEETSGGTTSTGDTGTDAASESSNAPASADSLPAIQQSILDGSGILDNVTIRQTFANTAIVGDSITESTWEYGYLDQDVVISQRGLSVINADEQIATTIAMHPKAVFMAFGANDLESYESNVQGFIDGYKMQVQKLLDALPGVPIYINCILPLTESAIAATPALQYYPQYNEALSAMCDELGLTYIDDSFIVENDSSIYEPDGEHVISEYYPKWLSYMAAVAGL